MRATPWPQAANRGRFSLATYNVMAITLVGWAKARAPPPTQTRDSRAPCPPTASGQAGPSTVGTAHDRPSPLRGGANAYSPSKTGVNALMAPLQSLGLLRALSVLTKRTQRGKLPNAANQRNHMGMRLIALTTLATLALLLIADLSRAQPPQFPARTVRIVVPYPAGGGT